MEYGITDAREAFVHSLEVVVEQRSHIGHIMLKLSESRIDRRTD
jgi:hypothetical protein